MQQNQASGISDNRITTFYIKIALVKYEWRYEIVSLFQ